MDKKSLRYADFFLLEFILWFLKFTDAVFCFVLFFFSGEFFVGCDFCHQFLVKYFEKWGGRFAPFY